MYHPAGKPPGGTSIVPSFRNPRSISPESTPIAAICRWTGTDLAKCAAWAAGTDVARGTDVACDKDVGDGSTRLVPEIDGATATPVCPEQPAVMTVIATNDATTPGITGERARGGRRFAERGRNRLPSSAFLRSSDDAGV